MMVMYVGLCKISNTFFAILFVIVDALVCDGCCRCFFARLDLLSTTNLQYTQKGPSQRSGSLPSSRDPWETVKFESYGGAK